MTAAYRPDVVELLARLRAAGLGQEGPRFEPDPKLVSWRGFSRFAESHLRIVDMRKQLRPLRLNWMQRRIVLEELRARRAGRRPYFLILKYRKGGVTTLQQALAYWQIWRRRHQQCITLAHRLEDMEIIFRMVNLFYAYQPIGQRHAKSGATKHWIEFPSWDSIYFSGVAGGGKLGRGSTFSRVHLSEAAFYSDLSATWTALANSVGPETAVVLESTPNGREGEGKTFFDFWQAAKARKSMFIPLFFPWWMNPAHRLPLEAPDELGTLDGRERELQQRHQLSLEQLKWRREEAMRLVADGRRAELIDQEHPSDDETCFLYGAEGYYSRELCIQRKLDCVPPIRTEQDGRLRIWKEPTAGMAVVLGGDVSEGRGASDSALVGLDANTGEQVLSYQFNRVAPDEFGSVIIGDRRTGLGWRWADPATNEPAFVVLERNNTGHAALTGLLKIADYPREKVYHHTHILKDEIPPKYDKLPGWPHGGQTHVQLTTAVGQMLREGWPKIMDVEVWNSIARVGAGSTGADFSDRDLAVAAGLAFIGMDEARQAASSLMYIGGKVEAY